MTSKPKLNLTPSSPVLIVAVDPGGTTGLAAWNYRTGKWLRAQIEHCEEDSNLQSVLAFLNVQLRGMEPITSSTMMHLIVERFDFRMEERYRDRIDYTAAEVIGALRVWASDRECVKLIRVGAGLGKGFWRDDRIKTLRLWVPGARHAMDATRHLLRYRSFTLNEQWLFDPFKPPAGLDDGGELQKSGEDAEAIKRQLGL